MTLGLKINSTCMCMSSILMQNTQPRKRYTNNTPANANIKVVKSTVSKCTQYINKSALPFSVSVKS